MTKYKILTGSDVIYDSSNKYEYPVTEPVLNLELGEAGNLEFTMLPGHPLHGQLLEMQSFVSAYQDDTQLFYGRVLQADEDIYNQIKITCEGALTFLLDSEMEPGTYTETITTFFTRCVNAHNQQVEEAKQFAVGVVQHEEADKTLEFKLEGYNQTRQVINNLLTGKHGGFLNVRYENGQRYLDYIQRFSNANNQPIKTGVNVIDRDKHISGENLYTIVRPIGKNGLTIEGASSVNLLANPSLVQGKYLDQGGGDRIRTNEGMVYSGFIQVTPGAKYLYGPGDVYVSLYDENEICMKTLDPDGTYSVTIPESIEGFENAVKYVRLSYHSSYDGRITFIASAGKTSLISGNGGKAGYALGFAYTDVQIEALSAPDTSVRTGEPAVALSMISREAEQETPGWNYNQAYISVNPGQTFLSIPGAVKANFYTYDSSSQQYICKDAYLPETDIGCDIFTVPAGVSHMRLSYPNRFGSDMNVFSYANGDNLASRNTGGSAGKIEYHPGEVEKTDSAWCYSSTYIDIDENTYYTGGPSPIRISFYDEDKHFISCEYANREGLTMHYAQSPEGAKYARVSFLSQYASEQQLQKGKALILTELDAGTKTILMPERIAKYGQIVHTENFSDISDAQELYNAAVEWIALHQSMLPASVDIGIVDFHLLNPDIEGFELGDVYDNLEGFPTEAVTIASMTKDMENPANDKLTLKNLAELSGADAGASGGSLSSKYASNGGGSGGSGNGSKYKYYSESDDNSWAKISGVKEIGLKALEMLNIEAPRIKLLAEERDGIKARLDLLAKGKDGNESRITMTEAAVAVNADNIIHQAKNLYNIADNIVTVTDTMFTHANLIWNEAKDIVTIAENVYTVADHIGILANTMSIVVGDLDILANNIRVTACTLDLNIGELNASIGTINASIGTINTSIGTINASIGTINASIGTINASIGTINASIGTINASIGTINASIGTINTSIGTINASIGTINASIGTINASIGTINASIGTINASIGTINASIGTINASIGTINASIGTISASIGTIDTSIGTINASIGTINASIGTINTSIDTLNFNVSNLIGQMDNVYVNIGNLNATVGTLYTNVQNLNAEVGTINASIGTINTSIGTINASIGTINASIGTINTSIGTINASISTINTSIGTLSSRIDTANYSINTLNATVGNMNISGDTITIKGNTIDLGGFVSVEDLSVERGRIDALYGGSAQVNGLYSKGGITALGFITAGQYVNSSDVQINGNTLKNAIASFGSASESNGSISIPTTTIGGTAGPPINFNIAATQFYQDGVAAAGAITLTGTWSGSTYTVAGTTASDSKSNSTTFSAGTGTGNQSSGGQYTINSFNSSHRAYGYVNASTLSAGRLFTFNVDASSVYDEGLADGALNQRSVSGLETITLTSSDTGSNVRKTIDVFYDNDDEGSVTAVVDASEVYAAGWIKGYNDAVAELNLQGNTLTVPATTSAYNTSATETHTISASATVRGPSSVASHTAYAQAIANAYFDTTWVDSDTASNTVDYSNWT